MPRETKYFVDENGNYLGAFEGEFPSEWADQNIPSKAVEVLSPPAHGKQKWDGVQFLALNPADVPAQPLTDAQALEKALIKKGVVLKSEITAEKVG